VTAEWIAVVAAAAAGWLSLGGGTPVLVASGQARVPARRVVTGGVVGVVIIGAVAELGSARLLLVAGGLVVVSVIARRLVSGVRRRGERHMMAAAVIELCDALAAELNAGIPVARAVDVACADLPVWRPLRLTAQLGGDVSDALRRVAVRPGADGLLAVAAAFEVATRSGAALAAVLDRVGTALRDDQDARAEVSAAVAPSRATAKLLAVLPVFGLALGVSMGARPLDFLLGTTVGLGCLASGLLLGLVGVLWVDRLADAAES
jgi:tight adherence protein B